MKTSSSLSVRENRAFTLVELLVVIVIISVLAGFLVPQLMVTYKDGINLKTRAVAMELKNGIQAFQADYGRFPVDSAAANDADAVLVTDGSTTVVDSLMGLPANAGSQELNPRMTKFSEFPPAKGDYHGVLTGTRPHALHDYWGRPFQVILDTNGDHQVENPDAKSSDPKVSMPGGKPVGAFLPLEVIVFSAGRDGVPHTADDVASWR
jgi:prepilin-type N-terminal cleavage/methylation domain-containing protein